MQGSNSKPVWLERLTYPQSLVRPVKIRHQYPSLAQCWWRVSAEYIWKSVVLLEVAVHLSHLFGLFFLTAVHTFEVEIIFTLLRQIFFQSTQLINQITASYTRDGSLTAEKSLGIFATFPGVEVHVLSRITHMVKSGRCCISWKFSPWSQFAPT